MLSGTTGCYGYGPSLVTGMTGGGAGMAERLVNGSVFLAVPDSATSNISRLKYLASTPLLSILFSVDIKAYLLSFIFINSRIYRKNNSLTREFIL